MSLEAWGDDGDADRPYTQETVDEVVAEATAELRAMLAWAYGKLTAFGVGRGGNMESALMMDQIKLVLTHTQGINDAT